jgi:hypothetical protein
VQLPTLESGARFECCRSIVRRSVGIDSDGYYEDSWHASSSLLDDPDPITTVETLTELECLIFFYPLEQPWPFQRVVGPVDSFLNF